MIVLEGNTESHWWEKGNMAPLIYVKKERKEAFEHLKILPWTYTGH